MVIAAVGLGACDDRRPQPLTIDNALTADEIAAGRLTPEVMWKMSRAGSSSLSPDGTTLLYAQTDYNMAQNRGVTTIWVQDMASGAVTRLTDTASNNADPKWSADGRKIYFLSDRSGSMQVWRMNAAGGDATQITGSGSGEGVPNIEGFGVSPDEKHIWWVQAVQTARRKSSDVYEDMDKSKARIYDDLMARHWDYWDEGSYRHTFIGELGKGLVTGGTDIMPDAQWDAPLAPYFDMAEIAWNNAGTMLAYTCKPLTGTEYAVSTDSDIFVYVLESGVTQNICKPVNVNTGEPVASDKAVMAGYDKYPVWSPDDTKIAFLSQRRAGNESDKARLFLYDCRTGDMQDLTEDFDYNAMNVVWEDNDTIWFIAPIEATHQLCRISPSVGEVEVVTRGDHDINAFSMAGDRIVAEMCTISMATEFFGVDPGTDDKDDEIIFSPDPAVISEGFDIAEIQKYVSGEKKYRILAFSELTRFTVSVGDKSYDALNGTTEGITLEPVDKYNVRLTLSDAFFASCQAGDQEVTFRIEDANGGSSEVATTYRLEGLVPVTADDYDLWANTVTLRVVSFTPGTTVQFGLRSSGGEWQPMAGTSQGNDFITATYAPQWEEKTTADWSTPATVLPYSRLKKGTGISAGNTYDYKATVGSKELSGRFTADEGAPMTDGSLESWRSAQQFPGSGTNYTFWGSGYNPFAKELCTRDEAMPGRVGTYCAKLSATYNTLAKVPAPGNLFTGDFAIQVLGGMGGNVSFGKKFAYNARPRAVRFKYHATIGEVNYNLHGGKIPVGEMDKARIFVCIVDWTAQQKVFAGTKAPTGTWDPETQTEAANGPIIGYASKFIEETTQGDEMVEVILPINYYQDTAAAPDGKYNIVVSCSTSAYGDYMDACTTNVMYVDDFEWVY